MGREIRRAPAGWEHPMKECKYVPLFDQSYEDALDEWIENHRKWQRGEHPDQNTIYGKDYQFYADYAGDPPSVDEYRRERWTDEEATHYAMYETVSEGTPITPFFASKDDLIEFLCTREDSWGYGPIARHEAERFVDAEWAPSMIAKNVGTAHATIEHGYTALE